MLKHYSLNRLLVLVAAVGFGFLMIDTLLEHWNILGEEPMSFVAIGWSAVGLILGLVTAVRWKDPCIRRLQMFFAASVLVALLGVYYHVVEDDDEETVTTEQQLSEEKDKPILAPLAFAGVALIGTLGTARKWNAEVV